MRAAIDLDPTDTAVVNRYSYLATIWKESTEAGSGVPTSEQAETAKKLADLAKQIRAQLADKKIREGDVKTLDNFETNFRQHAMTLEATSTTAKNRK